MKVSLISLGCPKNRIDSEVIIGEFGVSGYEITQFPQDADIVIINTCAFIESARDEARKIIKQIVKLKEKKKSLLILVCGCLPQLAGSSLLDEFTQIDGIVGSSDFCKLPDIILKLKKNKKKITEIGTPNFIYNSHLPRLISTPSSYAYLKIAEGCSNHCSYCKIPQLRGEYRSREIKDILNEAHNIAGMGYKELILIAQDTTNFGIDKGERTLHKLLKELTKIKEFLWIRLLYTHPAHFDDKLISIIENSPQICKYIDLPLQHTHSDILKRMNRPSWEQTKPLIKKLQKSGITIRTTFLVGFPGEEEKHFNKLLSDIEEFRFDWAGAFTYSCETDTPASDLPDQVSFKVKKERVERVFELQKGITHKKNIARKNKQFLVLIDTKEKGYSIGHSEFQCPEIDGKCYCPKKLNAGDVFMGEVKKVKGEYDLEVG
ncbi:MAG: 30S ribosomal protein S12 methylthiotransferase RimO [bacterium]